MKKLILTAVFMASIIARADGLSDLIPYPFYAAQGAGQNQIQFIDDSLESLKFRIDMIRRAKVSIEAEYFIYNTDTAGRIFSKELAAAAKRGVKVRLLIDKSIPVGTFSEYYAKELIQRGVDVRFYNPAPIWKVSTIQFRDHRKLLSIDDKEAMTGGRNIADEYFDLSESFNFNDADVYVKGPIVKVMRESFDLYFNNHLSIRPRLPTRPSKPQYDDETDFQKIYDDETAKAQAFFDVIKEEVDARRRLAAKTNPLVKHKLRSCPMMTYSTDAPGADFTERIKPDYGTNFRFLRKTLYDKISTVDRQLIVASPYLIDTQAADELMNQVLAQGAKIDVYTNSLGSTDATYVAANMYLGLGRWLASGISVYFHDGHWIPRNPDSPQFVQEASAGLHAKMQVYVRKTGSEVMVGTYNVDNRSNFYNSEMAIFCAGNDELTHDVTKSIKGDQAYGLKVSADGKAVDDRNGKTTSIYAADPATILKMKLLTPIYWVLRDLM